MDGKDRTSLPYWGCNSVECIGELHLNTTILKGEDNVTKPPEPSGGFVVVGDTDRIYFFARSKSSENDSKSGRSTPATFTPATASPNSSAFDSSV